VPDLFLAASLESAPTEQNIDNFLAVYKQAAKLSVNVKLNSFCRNAELIASQTDALLRAWEGLALPSHIEQLMDKIVPAAVLTVTPTDGEHLNKTFAFCRALGFDRGKVAKSIADGCFRTFDSLVAAQNKEDGSSPYTQISLRESQKAHKIPSLGRILPAAASSGNCSFYTINGEQFPCPFVSASGKCEPEDRRRLVSIYERCQRDTEHAKAADHKNTTYKRTS